MGSGIAAHDRQCRYSRLYCSTSFPRARRIAICWRKVLLKNSSPPNRRDSRHKKKAKLVTTGNLEDHLDLLKDVDWIIEVVLEKLEVKQDVYRKVDAVRKKGSVVSSNTSTLPLHVLVKGMPDSFAADFMITHFFNPPRYHAPARNGGG